MLSFNLEVYYENNSRKSTLMGVQGSSLHENNVSTNTHYTKGYIYLNLFLTYNGEYVSSARKNLIDEH